MSEASSILNNLPHFLIRHIQELFDVFFGFCFPLLAEHLPLLQYFDDFFLLKFTWLVDIKENENSFRHWLAQFDFVLLAVLVVFVKLINIASEHFVVEITVLADFSFKKVKLVLEVLEGEVVIKADTVVRHRFPNLLALLQVSADLTALNETDDWTEEIFDAYGTFFVRVHVEELVVPQVVA